MFGHWLFTHFRPGSEPFYSLAQALVPLYEPEKNATEQMFQARQLAEYFVNGSVPLKDVFTRIERNYANHRVLLIADQFEELYTLCSDEKIRRSFLDILLAGFQSESDDFPSPPVLVSTMRVDFLGNALSYPPFADVLRNADIKIRSMNRSELSDIIGKPAQKLGVTFQDGLIERILDDVKDEPGNLPLLEFALTALWEKRTNKQLTHAAYAAIGEVQGALASHADTIYKNLNTSEKQQVSRIFMQLVRPGERTEDTRRLATKAELSEDNWSLVQYLADERLVVTSRSVDEQETVEVAHEALIQHWQLLQNWIDENHSQIIQKNRIERLALEWEDNKKSQDYLLQGKQLNEAQAFQKQESANLTLSSLANKFIQHSIRYRRNNRFRLIGFGFIPLVALAVFLGFFASREIKISQLRNTLKQTNGQKDSLARILALQELVRLGADLENIPLNNVNLENAVLGDAQLRGAKLNNVNFTNGNLAGANLETAHLEAANLKRVNLASANLIRAFLYRANLDSDLLKDANLRDAYLIDANLENAYLIDANLENAALTHANLQNTQLDNASLRGAKLFSANFQYSHLRGANFQYSYLQGVDFQYANFQGADLQGAKFGCASVESELKKCTNLSDAENLTPEQVKAAQNWQGACYSPDFRKKLGLSPENRKECKN